MGSSIDRFLSVNTPASRAPSRPIYSPPTPPAPLPAREEPSPLRERILTADQLFGGQVESSRVLGRDLDPAGASRVLDLSARTGIPADVIRQDPDGFARDFESKRISSQRLIDRAPRLAEWVAQDPARAALVAPDLPRLTGVARAFQRIGVDKRRGALREAMVEPGMRLLEGKALPGDEETLVRLQRDIDALPFVDDVGLATRALGATAEQLDQLFASTVSAGAGPLAAYAAGSALQRVPAAAPVGMAMKKVAPAFFALGMAQEAGKREAVHSFLEFRGMRDEEGRRLMDDETARGVAGIVGAVNGALEMVGMGAIATAVPGVRGMVSRASVKRLLANPTTRGAFLQYAKGVATGMAGEGTTETVQGLMQQFGAKLGELEGNAEYANASTSQVLSFLFSDYDWGQALAEGAMGASVGFVLGGSTGSLSLANDLVRARQATRFRSHLEGVVSGVAETGVAKQGTPEQLAEVLGKLVAEGRETVWLDASEFTMLFQGAKDAAGNSIDPASVAELLLGGDARAYQEAMEQGGSFAVPVSEVIGKLATRDAGMRAWVLDNLQESPEAMSAKEAREFGGTQLAQRLEELSAEAEQATTDPARQLLDEIATHVSTGLKQAGRSGREQRVGAATMRAQFETLLRMGVSVDRVRQAAIQNLGIRGPDWQEGAGATLTPEQQTAVDAAVMELEGTVEAGSPAEGTPGTPETPARLSALLKLGEALAAGEAPLEQAGDFGAELSAEAAADAAAPLEGEALVMAVERQLQRQQALIARARLYLERAGKLTAQDIAVLDSFAQANALPETIEIDGVQRPTRDSTGGMIALTEAAIRNFWKWFGESKVVDAQGRPLVVYHGTSENTSFESFKENPEEMGIHLGLTPEQADHFTRGVNLYGVRPELTEGPRIFPLYARLENPLRMVDWAEWTISRAGQQLVSLGIIDSFQLFDIAKSPSKDVQGRALMKAVQDAGYDGVVYLNRHEGIPRDEREQLIKAGIGFTGNTVGVSDQEYNRYAPSAADSYIVFDAKQVKSAFGNNGNFRRDRRSILEQAKRPSKPTSDIGHKRVATSGRYVGAPDWVTNGSQLARLRKQLHKLAIEGEVGRYWYEKSARAVMDFVGGDKALAEKFIGLLAIFSPNTGVAPNTTHAIRAWYQWKAGLPIVAGQFPVAMGERATQWLIEGKDWGGVKTNNFYLDLMEEINPALIDETHATMDMWMALAFDYGDKTLDQGPKYGFAKREIVRLAAEVGWRPHQVQAAIWTAIRSRVMRSAPERKAFEREAGILEPYTDPKTGRKGERVVKGREYDHYRAATRFGLERKGDIVAEIKEDDYDFGTALLERSVNVSWEATPGASTGILPGIHEASYARQQEYLRAVRAALSDEQGRDLIDQRLGLLTTNGLEGASGWQGKPSVSVQQLVAVTKDGTEITPTARTLINLAADLRGLLLGQEAVAWHYPIFDGSKAAENGTEYELGRPLAVDEVAQLYAQLEAELGHNYAPPVPTATGFRVLNFPDEKFADQSALDAKGRRALTKAMGAKNQQFHEAVRRAVAVMPFAGEVTDVQRFATDGELRENDWSRGDAQYRERIGAATAELGAVGTEGLADLQQWVDDDLRPRVEAVNRDFAERYGWDLLIVDDPAGVAGGVAQSQTFDVLNQSTPAITPGPLWFSALERAVERAKVEVQPGSQWWAWLKSNSGKLGIKKEELTLTGVEEWLTLKATERVRKGELLAFLDANGVRVEEVMLGGNAPSEMDLLEARRFAILDEMEALAPDDNEGRAELARELAENARDAETASIVRGDGGPTRFEGWTAQGGEEYRELALVLPTQPAMPETQVLVAKGHSFGSAQADDNRVAHVRFKTRTDVLGRLILFIEEIQSDWAQRGAEIGFQAKVGSEVTEQLDRMQRELDDLKESSTRALILVAGEIKNAFPGVPINYSDLKRQLNLRWRMLTGAGSFRDGQSVLDAYEAIGSGSQAQLQEVLRRTADIVAKALDTPMSDALWMVAADMSADDLIAALQPHMDQYLLYASKLRRWENLNRERTYLLETAGALNSDRPLAGPFVTDTEPWVALVLKRMIRYAAENGFDAIAWTTGAQQVERYESALREKVDRIVWTKTEEGVQLVGFKHSDKVVDTTEKEDRLSDAIGKAMSARILEDPAQSGEITGNNITIDSTGMAAFYDGIVPSVAGRLLKKLGGGAVGRIAFAPFARSSRSPVTVEVVDSSGFAPVDLDEETRKSLRMTLKALPRLNFPSDSTMPFVYTEPYRAFAAILGSGMQEMPFLDRVAWHASSVRGQLTDEQVQQVFGPIFEYFGATMRFVAPPLSEQRGFDITPQMRETALQGMPLFQPKQAKEAGPRGRIYRYAGGRFDIQLLASADQSTFLHEMAHFFLALRSQIASEEGAPAALVEDLGKLDQWFGDNHAALKREAGMYLQTAYTIEATRDSNGTPVWIITDPRGRRSAFDTEEEAVRVGTQRREATFKDLLAMDEAMVRAAVGRRTQRALTDSEALLTVAMEEQFARGFELYLREGKAPSLELRNIFSTFAAWLTRIYRDLRQLNVQLTPEVRAVMDRMLATEEQIARAQLQRGERPLFTHQTAADLVALGMSEADATKYVALLNEAKVAAHEEMRAKLMHDLTRLDQKWWKKERAKVKQLATDAAHAMPVYRAWSLLARGVLPNGEALAGLPPRFKLDRDAAFALAPVTMQDGEPVSALESLPGRRVYEANGLDPDVVAGALGYASGRELVQALLAAQPMAQYIDAQTDAKMQELYPENFAAEQQAAIALEAIHNGEREAVLRHELKVLVAMNLKGAMGLMKKLALRLPERSEVAALAARVLGRKPIGKLRPDEYLRGEAKAARLAQEAIVKGDWLEAIQQKQREILNHALWREVTAIRAEVKADRTDLARMFRADARIAPTRDMNLVNAARTVLARVGLARGDAAPETYLEKVQRYEPDTYNALLPLLVTGVAARTDPKTLTVDEYRDTMVVARAFWQQAKRMQEVTIRGRKVRLADVVMDLTNDLEAKGPGKLARAGHSQAFSESEDLKSKALGLVASLRRVEAWVDMMDGGAPDGMWRRYLWEPISEAAVRYRLARSTMTDAYAALVEPLRGTLTNEAIDGTEIGYTFKNKAELLGAMLHTGNKGEGSNFDKLIRGRASLVESENAQRERRGLPPKVSQWSEQNWERMIDRLEATGVLTAADYQFLQGVWDLFESRKADAQKVHREMVGYYFNEVTATPLQTRFGTFRGGYFPARADGRLSIEAQLREDKMAAEIGAETQMFPTPPRGFTKSRNDTYAAPLVMDLDLVTMHIDAVERFVHLAVPVRDVNRILLDRTFANTLKAFDPSVSSNMLAPWIRRASKQTVAFPTTGSGGQAFDALARFARGTASLNAMVANVVNTMQQITGFSIAALKVRPRYLGAAFVRVVRAPKEMASFVNATSEFMRARNATQLFEVRQEIERITSEQSALDTVRESASRHGYFLQAAAQHFIDNVTWLGAYEEATVGGADATTARRAADAAVRLTQGSFAPEDISRAATGNAFARLFTMYFDYFNMQANILGTELGKLVYNGMGVKNNASRALFVVLLGFTIPAFLGEVIAQGMRGDIADDDDDGYLDEWLELFFSSQARTAMAFAPGVGQVGAMVISLGNEKVYDDRLSLSPITTILESAARGAYVPMKLFSEEEFKRRDIRDLLSLLAVGTRLPLVPLAKPAQYLYDVQQGDAVPTGAVDFTRGLVVGR